MIKGITQIRLLKTRYLTSMQDLFYQTMHAKLDVIEIVTISKGSEHWTIV